MTTKEILNKNVQEFIDGMQYHNTPLNSRAKALLRCFVDTKANHIYEDFLKLIEKEFRSAKEL
jgi:hypothetical protein